MKGTVETLACLAISLSASTFFGQTMYSVTDLGLLSGTSGSVARAVNSSGRVVGYGSLNSRDVALLWRNSRADAQVIVPPGSNSVFSEAYGINDSGQVVGAFQDTSSTSFPFLYNSDSGSFERLGAGSIKGEARAINQSGVVAGSALSEDYLSTAFTFNGKTITMYPTAAGHSQAWGINNAGDLAGFVVHSQVTLPAIYNATASRWIEFAMPSDAFGGYLMSINDTGIAVGAWVQGESKINHPLVVRKDGSTINFVSPPFENLWLWQVNNAGLAVGMGQLQDEQVARAIAYDTKRDEWIDLATRIINRSETSGQLITANGISSDGRIACIGLVKQGESYEWHAFLLTPTPLYKALVQPPIDMDGLTVLSAVRGVVPIKFSLTEDDAPTCSLPAATIAITRTAGGTAGSVDESTDRTPADSGSKFRIDSTACQYVYNLAARSLGVGSFRVDISIEGSVVGSAVFAFK